MYPLKPTLADTTVCIIDTQNHALASRAMRLTLSAMEFGDAIYLSDRDTDTGGARYIPIARLQNRRDYSRFVIKELARHIEADYALIIQWDGYVVNPQAWSDQFLQYDYIGARWGFHHDAHCVGNGGFSLRSRRLLQALRDPDIDTFEPEDEMICRRYRPLLESRHGIRFAPPEVADAFSFETTYPQGIPLGFHGLFNMWLFVADEEIPALIEAMPRSVLASIQLRQLAKNLIDLKRLVAARSVLTRRLSAFPDDGDCARMLAALDPPRRQPLTTASKTTGRNDPCPCGSGKRYKHCCGSAAASPPRAGDNTPPAADGAATNVDAALQHAMSRHQARQLRAAREGYLAILAAGENPVAEHYLGVIDMQEGRPADGEARIRRALARRSDVPDFHNNLGLCLRAQHRLEEAIASYRAALDLHPGYAPAWSNIGLDLHKLGRLDEALDAFNHAVALDDRVAQTRFSRALVLLARGDYQTGWVEYEWRARCPEYASGYNLPSGIDAAPLWQGQDLQGKSILLLDEQGIGDTLQFIRYAAVLAARGARVSLHCRAAHVAELLRTAPGIDHVFTPGTLVPRHDILCRVMSLPRLCGTTSVSTIPTAAAYLRAPEARRLPWRNRLAGYRSHLRIGIAWSGNPRNADDYNRSCPLTAFAPLFELRNCMWISLQLGAGREQLDGVPNPPVDWGDDQHGYLDTAALMCELDLIVTVDTSIAHAAGALGVPTFLLLSYSPDFRWLAGRDDSPWYPGLRLFRQRKRGDWASVMAPLADALRHRLEELSR